MIFAFGKLTLNGCFTVGNKKRNNYLGKIVFNWTPFGSPISILGGPISINILRRTLTKILNKSPVYTPTFQHLTFLGSSIFLQFNNVNLLLVIFLNLLLVKAEKHTVRQKYFLLPPRIKGLDRYVSHLILCKTSSS